jgi:hypothetical protein
MREASPRLPPVVDHLIPRPDQEAPWIVMSAHVLVGMPDPAWAVEGASQIPEVARTPAGMPACEPQVTGGIARHDHDRLTGRQSLQLTISPTRKVSTLFICRCETLDPDA